MGHGTIKMHCRVVDVACRHHNNQIKKFRQFSKMQMQPGSVACGAFCADLMSGPVPRFVFH
jgi:hypothetical protein